LSELVVEEVAVEVHMGQARVDHHGVEEEFGNARLETIV